MNLKEFVKDALVSIDSAVDDARKETQRDIYFSTTTDQRTVEFDVAVSVDKINEMSGKAGIKVLSFFEGDGNVMKENKNSTVSRIHFGVHIDSSTKQEENIRLSRYRHETDDDYNPAR